MKKFEYQHILEAMAERAKVSDTPWDVIQKRFSGAYSDLKSMPTFSEDGVYRVKPTAIYINGYDVPSPERQAPKEFVRYYTPALERRDLILAKYWIFDEDDIYMLENGLVHLDINAACAHAKALLSFTKK